MLLVFSTALKKKKGNPVFANILHAFHTLPLNSENSYRTYLLPFLYLRHEHLSRCKHALKKKLSFFFFFFFFFFGYTFILIRFSYNNILFCLDKHTYYNTETMDIKTYLSRLGLVQHTETMLINGIETIDDLEGLKRADLVGIRIPLGHANRILKGLVDVGNEVPKPIQKKIKLTASVRIMVVMDTTGSMNSFLLSLKETIPQMFSVFNILFQGDAQLDLIAYKDYCDGTKVLTHSYGSEADAMDFAKSLRPNGGGDTPEAVKTAFNEALYRINESPSTPTVVFHYTDAPPHHRQTKSSSDNFNAERSKLDQKQPGFDWINISRTFRKLSVPCFTFLPHGSTSSLHHIYSCVGEVIVLPDTQPYTITKHSIGLLSQLIGDSCDFVTTAKCLYYDSKVLEKLNDANLHENNAHELLGLRREQKKGISIKRQKQDPLLKTLTSMGFVDEFSNVEALRLSGDDVQKAMNILTNTPELVKSNKATLIEKSFNSFHPLNSIKKDTSVLPKLFKTNSDFRDLVYRVLTDLLTPTKVSSLTYNSITGRLWRLVCCNREDNRFRTLQEGIDGCIVSLGKAKDTTKRDDLLRWIDESYNQGEELIQRFTSVINSSKTDKIEVLISNPTGVTLDKFPSRKDIRSIHSPSPGVLGQLQNFLTTLQSAKVHKLKLIQTLQDKQSPKFIPMMLSNSDFFSSLIHLLEPGLILSLRPACIIACVAMLSGNKHLKSRAEAFLSSVKGCWIPHPEKYDIYPEILSKEFGYLVRNISEKYLTSTEVKLFNNINYYERVKKTLQYRLQSSTGYRPQHNRLYHDHKKQCKGCNQNRSISLMINNDTCALCYHSVEALENDPEKSHLVECRTCNCIYAVVRIDLLRVAPKCYYCREHKQVKPTRQCSNCKMNFIISDAAADNSCCGVCSNNIKEGIHSQEITLLQLLHNSDSNYIVEKVLGLSSILTGQLIESRNLFKLWKAGSQFRIPFMNDCFSAKCPSDINNSEWFVDSKKNIPILNKQEMATDIVKTITTGSLTTCCNLCFEEYSFHHLQSPCGHCNNICCSDCLKSWYSSLKPGHLYSPTLSLCPFCKNIPKGAVLRKFNPQACCIITSRVAHKTQQTIKFKTDMSYAWCIKCYKVKEAFPKACGELAQTELTNFKCESCQIVMVDSKSKNCPSCDVPTVKLDGCSHLTCVCGCHWCWECGEEFPDVYEHLQDVHGGIMFDYDTDENNYNDDEDPY